MTKTGPDFDPAGYAPVAERIRLFYHAHPLGRIETQMVARTEHEIVFKALVYREAADQQPAATGWAAEREGDGDINLVACLENTETSAIGRALANLGFTASRQRPSAEEMVRASRGRARLVRTRLPRPGSASNPRGANSRRTVAEPMRSAGPYESRTDQMLADATDDALRMIGHAQRAGLAAERAESLCARLRAGLSLRSIERLESVMRRWLLRHSPGDFA